MRKSSTMILLICLITWVSSCMMIYWLLCHFAIKQYTFSKLGTLGTLWTYELLGHIVMKMMNFFSIQMLRQVAFLFKLLIFTQVQQALHFRFPRIVKKNNALG